LKLYAPALQLALPPQICVVAGKVERPPKVRQPIKAQISLNGEESHESVSKKVHERV
jgi:hypothetical protein